MTAPDDAPGSPSAEPHATTVSPVASPEVGEVLQALSPEAQLRRKVRFTKAFAIVEAASYCLLAVFMFRKYVLDLRSGTNYVLLRITAYFHGFISIAFAVMVLDIHRALRWSKTFLVVTLLGPPGALIAHRRLRTQPLPDTVDPRSMLF